MPVPPAQGLALLGPTDLEHHLAAIHQTPGLRVVGYWGDAPAPADVPHVQNPRDLLQQHQTSGVVIGGEAAQREYWTGEALRLGKSVLSCGLPATTSTRLRQLMEAARQADVEVCMVPRIEREAEVAAAPLGTVFVSMRGWVPQSVLRGTRDGILVHWAAPCLQILADRFGRLDSVYARTRSLGLNRPEEDLATAQLRFTSGAEGVVSFCGLGERSGVELEEWGRGECRPHRWEWASTGPGPLEGVYAAFERLLRSGEAPPVSLRVPLAGLAWAEWCQQAARLDREIHANEVVHE